MFDFLPVITYLAGYCCYAVWKKMKCTICKELITCNDVENLPDNNLYIKGVSRGSLLYPEESVVNIVMYNYIVINKLTQIPDITRSSQQRNLATEITNNIIIDNDAFLPMYNCENGHSIDKIQKMLLWASTNSLLNNFCTRENDNIYLKKNSHQGKKRKIQTLT